uniref:RING-type domain-containing protein n=1 Tax=Petromyzon marinus TaxID=7757 RepID=S4RXG1_PETMA
SATPSESVDSELCCSICLDTFVYPSTLSCGHSFCLRCLEAAWETASRMAMVVVCDNCGDDQTPAVKTCLRCEMSFCVSHLKPHVENPRLSDHHLVAPIANLKERRCREHSRELEFYCTIDSSL